MLPFRHRELIDRQPVVVVRRVEVDDPGLCPGDRSVLAPVFDRHPIDQHSVKNAVALHQRWRVAAQQLAARIVQRLVRQVWIQPHERRAKSPVQHHIAIIRIAAFSAGFADRYVRTVQYRIAKRFEPGERGVLDDGFSKLRH